MAKILAQGISGARTTISIRHGYDALILAQGISGARTTRLDLRKNGCIRDFSTGNKWC